MNKNADSGLIKKGVKTALIVEGGGMRGVFSAGVLNAFGTSGFDPFDLYIGVSAGACNLAAYLAGQHDRSNFIIHKWSATSRFINLPRFLMGGHFMDLDWLWDITISEYRLDLDHIIRTLKKRKKEYVIVGTSMESGDPLYLNPDKDNLEHYLKVSSALPILYRNTPEVNGIKAADGGISDPIPVLEAYKRGARNIVVIRSRPVEYEKKESRLSFMYPILFRKYPGAAMAMMKRHRYYMDAVNFIKSPPAGVTVFEINPSADSRVGRTTKDSKKLSEEYIYGIKTGENFIKNPDRFAYVNAGGNIKKS